MKQIFMTITLLISMSASVAMADKYTGGDCSVGQLMHAIQKECGTNIQWTRGEISFYQGENTDSYNVPVTNGSKEMTVRTDSGFCTSLDVRSACPNK